MEQETPTMSSRRPLGDITMGCVEKHLRKIEGRLKTFVESITEDSTQCKARKDIVAQLVWFEAQKIDASIRRIVKS